MPRPLIISTDPGVDDAVALVLALRSPEVDVRAVVATFGNVGLDATLPNAGRLLALAGRPDVPWRSGPPGRWCTGANSGPGTCTAPTGSAGEPRRCRIRSRRWPGPGSH